MGLGSFRVADTDRPQLLENMDSLSVGSGCGPLIWWYRSFINTHNKGLRPCNFYLKTANAVRAHMHGESNGLSALSVLSLLSYSLLVFYRLILRCGNEEVEWSVSVSIPIVQYASVDEYLVDWMFITIDCLGAFFSLLALSRIDCLD